MLVNCQNTPTVLSEVEDIGELSNTLTVLTLRWKMLVNCQNTPTVLTPRQRDTALW